MNPLDKLEQQAMKIKQVRGLIEEKNIMDVLLFEDFDKLKGENISTSAGKSRIVKAMEEDTYYKKLGNIWYAFKIPEMPTPILPELSETTPRIDNFQRVEADIKEINNQFFKARSYIDDNISKLNERIDKLDNTMAEGFVLLERQIDSIKETLELDVNQIDNKKESKA